MKFAIGIGEKEPTEAPYLLSYYNCGDHNLRRKNKINLLSDLKQCK